MSKNSRNYKISQNFLRSPKTALMLVGHTNIRKKDFCVDIGAGSGVFTYALSKKSAEVLAIEFDKETFNKLQKNSENLKNVKTLHADFLKFNLKKLPENYKICANPPFHLSSKIITKITNLKENPPKSAFFIFQKQFARKLIATHNNFTASLGVKIYPFFEVKIKKPLRKTDFTPPPAVDTVFFEVKRRETFLIKADQQKEYNDFIDKMYSTPEFYKRNCTLRFKIKKPSELDGEDWLLIWQNFKNSDKMD